jgi:hypothetical protein
MSEAAPAWRAQVVGAYRDRVERLTLYRFELAQPGEHGLPTGVTLLRANDALLAQMRAQHPREFTERKHRILRDRLTAGHQHCYVLQDWQGQLLGYCHTATESTVNERINYAVRLHHREVYMYDDHVFASYRRQGLHRYSIVERCRRAEARGYRVGTTIISDKNTASIHSYAAVGLLPHRLLFHLRGRGRTYALPAGALGWGRRRVSPP